MAPRRGKRPTKRPAKRPATKRAAKRPAAKRAAARKAPKRAAPRKLAKRAAPRKLAKRAAPARGARGVRAAKAPRAGAAKRPRPPPRPSRGGPRVRASRDGLLGAAERLVEKALARGARSAEAFAMEEAGTHLTIERGTISNASVAREAGFAIRVVDAGGRVGFAYATDEAGAERAIGTALDAARVLPAARRFDFPHAARYPRVARLFDADVAALPVEDGLDACASMIRAATERAPGITVAGGGLGWGEERVAIANSNGVAGEHRATSVGGSLSTVLREGSQVTTGFEFGRSTRLDVDFAAIGHEAADLALRSRNPKPLPSGETTVLFRPSALDGLLDMLFLKAVLASNAAAGQSVYSGRVGDEVLPRAYSIIEDGRLAGGRRSAPFDDEGVPTATTAIVRDGRLATFLDDVAGAAERGGRATGSAVRAERLGTSRSFRAPPAAAGLNLRFDGPRKPFAKLVEGVERGVLVYDAMGAHTANAASGDFSVNSSLLFAIEDGRIARAAAPAMISGNLPQALARLGGLADDERDAGGGMGPAAIHVPTLRLDGLRVTSG